MPNTDPRVSLRARFVSRGIPYPIPNLHGSGKGLYWDMNGTGYGSSWTMGERCSSHI